MCSASKLKGRFLVENLTRGLIQVQPYVKRAPHQVVGIYAHILQK